MREESWKINSHLLTSPWPYKCGECWHLHDPAIIYEHPPLPSTARKPFIYYLLAALAHRLK